MNVLILSSRLCLWRNIRLGAIISSSIPHSSQSKTATFSCCFKMDMSYSMKSLLLKDKKPNVSLSSKSKLTIAVEGNIGSGKSTLLSHFQENDLIETVAEPIEKWTNVKGHNALGLLYEDIERWSFSFNMYAMLTRVNMHMKQHTKPVKMLERSLHSTKHCFIQHAFMNNTINGFENSILNQWYSHLVSEDRANVDLILYVRADPDVCYERLKKRSRKEEAGVPKEFLETLHDLHEDWLIHEKYPLPAPVLVVDSNYDLPTMKKIFAQTQQDILCS